MDPPVSTGRSARLALVAVGLLVLLGVVAFASRSGLGHQSQAKPSPGYLNWAFTAFLIVFVAAIPLAAWMFVVQAREGSVKRPTFASRVVASVGLAICFGLVAYVILQLKKHGGHGLHFNPKGLSNTANVLNKRTGKRVRYEPQFEWTMVWIAIAVVAVGGGWFYYSWRTRKKRTAVPLEREQTVVEDFAASIGAAIDDLEAEPDARRAVIATYARMEAVLARNGLSRKPSETPVEYLRRILLGLTSRGDAVSTLTSLFEQAKFSRHTIDGQMKQEAIGALRAIRTDLQEGEG
jgi:hypothetical protein